jgi:hypothetical protein
MNSNHFKTSYFSLSLARQIKCLINFKFDSHKTKVFSDVKLNCKCTSYTKYIDVYGLLVDAIVIELTFKLEFHRIFQQNKSFKSSSQNSFLIQLSK